MSTWLDILGLVCRDSLLFLMVFGMSATALPAWVAFQEDDASASKALVGELFGWNPPPPDEEVALPVDESHWPTPYREGLEEILEQEETLPPQAGEDRNPVLRL